MQLTSRVMSSLVCVAFWGPWSSAADKHSVMVNTTRDYQCALQQSSHKPLGVLLSLRYRNIPSLLRHKHSCITSDLRQQLQVCVGFSGPSPLSSLSRLSLSFWWRFSVVFLLSCAFLLLLFAFLRAGLCFSSLLPNHRGKIKTCKCSLLARKTWVRVFYTAASVPY